MCYWQNMIFWKCNNVLNITEYPEYCNILNIAVIYLYNKKHSYFFTLCFVGKHIRSASDDFVSEITDDMNFHQMVLDKTQDRQHMESRGREGQRKQAEDVNKGRGGDQD